MKNIKLLFILFSLILLSSCSVIKTISLLKSGSIDNTNFSETINYENRAGLIIIKAEINGNIYDFIFDTGAPCAISIELAEKLALKPEVYVNSSDSKGNKEKTGFVEINKIKIAGTNFTNIGAAIIDFNKTQEIQCIGVDGIIGANLMKNAKWKINYQENTIQFTDNLDNLNITDSSSPINFTSSVTGTPLLNVTLPYDIQVKKVKFDSGFMGGLSLSAKVYKKLIENENLKIIKGYGASSTGAYGTNVDTSFFLKLVKIKVENLYISNIITEFTNDNISIIGNEIF
ncbi:MAG: retroviral-like aspartic protease family protein [Bacteroidales bacterium]|nr:retroviral-like aspartic protease family protein [Bacteroidales bacterium]